MLHNDLYAGRLVCGACRGTYAAIGRDHLGCSRARRQGDCPDTKGLKRARLEAMILVSPESRLMRPAHVESFPAGLHAEINRDSAGRERRLAAMRNETRAGQQEAQGPDRRDRRRAAFGWPSGVAGRTGPPQADP